MYVGASLGVLLFDYIPQQASRGCGWQVVPSY